MNKENINKIIMNLNTSPLMRKSGERLMIGVDGSLKIQNGQDLFDFAKPDDLEEYLLGFERGFFFHSYMTRNQS